MSSQSVYRTYRFIDKDPIIDKVRTVLEDEGLLKKPGIVHELSGVATATLDGWFKGDTKRPQAATIGAVISSVGYDMQFVKAKDIDIDRELKLAANWLLRQNSKRPARKRVNGHRK
jgi:hypothetical protein